MTPSSDCGGAGGRRTWRGNNARIITTKKGGAGAHEPAPHPRGWKRRHGPDGRMERGRLGRSEVRGPGCGRDGRAPCNRLRQAISRAAISLRAARCSLLWPSQRNMSDSRRERESGLPGGRSADPAEPDVSATRLDDLARPTAPGATDGLFAGACALRWPRHPRCPPRRGGFSGAGWGCYPWAP